MKDRKSRFLTQKSSGVGLRAQVMRITVLSLLPLILYGRVHAQPVSKTPPSAQYRETSITLAQIVARQQATLRQIKNAEGAVVWRENIFTTASAAPPLRVIHFAYTTTASVSLTLPWDGKSPIGRSRENADWSKVLAAFLIRDDSVYSIDAKKKSPKGWITEVPYNPAVHEKNPIVSFRISLLADEQVSLLDLYQTLSSMKNKPSIWSFGYGDEERLVVRFTNDELPNEELVYVINPQKGYLNEYIVRDSKGKKLFETYITIGKANGIWVPARRIHYEYSRDGRLLRSSEWYFHSLLVNEKLAPNTFTFSYFHLPPEAWPQSIQTNMPAATDRK